MIPSSCTVPPHAGLNGRRLSMHTNHLAHFPNIAAQAVISLVQQIGSLVPKLRHPQKEEIKAALESVGENRSPGFWYITDRLKEEAEAFRSAFDAGAGVSSSVCICCCTRACSGHAVTLRISKYIHISTGLFIDGNDSHIEQGFQQIGCTRCAPYCIVVDHKCPSAVNLL